MNEETSIPIGREDARLALAEIEQVLTQTRMAIAEGATAPVLILWGCLWIAADLLIQFIPSAVNYAWSVMAVLGFLGMGYLASHRQTQVRRSEGWRIGICWVVVFCFAIIWMSLLLPWDLMTKDLPPAMSVQIGCKIEVYWHTIPMFGLIICGLWLGRFLVWLGLIVTLIILACYYFFPNNFLLWAGLGGGGSLIASGVFIRKFWK